MDPLRELGKLLLIAGVVLVGAGALLCSAGSCRSGSAGLPGDIAYQGRHGSFYFPIVTCIVLSVALTLIFWIVNLLPPLRRHEPNIPLRSRMPERHVWKVSELTEQIGDLLEGAFQDVWIEGEVSNYHAAQSGHLYFTLKDARSQIRCVCFRDQARGLKFRPEDGLHITVRGSLGVYELRGEYQVYVSHIEPVGLGRAAACLRATEEKAAGRGLFDEARKKPLPVLPRCIGVVTSPTRRGDSRHSARAEAALRKCARAALSGEGAGRGRGGGNRRGAALFQSREIRGRADRGARRRLARRSVGVQRRDRGARDRGIGNSGDHRRGPRDGFHHRRFRRRPARAHAFGGRGNRGAFARRNSNATSPSTSGSSSSRCAICFRERRHRVRDLQTHRGFRQLELLVRRRHQQVDELAASLGNGLRLRLAIAASG